MHAILLLGCLVLGKTDYLLSSAHMIHDDTLSTNRLAETAGLSQSLHGNSTPFVNKFSVKKRPPPPANCIPLWGDCKFPANVCCDYCAFCQCRLFKTVCYCRMGNPQC
ncbi:agouti signaling protein 1 [Genypterus blacodes]|uniref:agouti signaling protein 1 n=1 Tax=Genypterus blacodes TaxID=154954 RepID=UPI003F75CEA3